MAGKNRVLIVSSDATLVKQGIQALSAAGYDVSLNSHASDVPKSLQHQLPDIILLSEKLPDGSGLELCQRIRLYVDTFMPIIIMLPNPTPDARVNAFDHGADDCIEARFDPRELVARVRSMLRLKNAIDNLYKSREELDEARERLERLAVLDGLTDLFNHRHMHEILDDEIERARRYSIPLSVIMFDMDKFSEVNDRHGHQTGDMVLRDVAALISKNCRSTDRVCRYGGDEMLIICPHTDLKQAVRLAQRLRLALKRTTFYSDRGPIKVTGSFGVASLATAGTKQDLLRQADEAHYAAKALGGDHVMEWTAMPIPKLEAAEARTPRREARK